MRHVINFVRDNIAFWMLLAVMAWMLLIHRLTGSTLVF